MKKYLLGLLGSMWLSVASAGVVCTVPFNLQNNTTADATQVMANYNAILACLLNAAHSGANSDITSLTGLTTPLTPAEGGSTVYVGGTSTGSGNSQVVAAPVPIGFSLTAGNQIVFIAGFANTSTTQFNINGTGLKNVFRRTPGGVGALNGGEIQVGDIVVATYDGTQYQLNTVASQVGGFGTQTTISSGSTVDLSLALNHNALISGTTTVTTFGSSTSTFLPVYKLKFSGSLTITYNATTMILPGAGDITTQANDTATALYLGQGNWQVIDYAAASGTGVVANTPLCGATGFLAQNNAGTPNTSYDMSADVAVMVNTTGAAKTVSAPSITINATVNGANGLDTGALAASTWYYGWLINNGTTTSGLLSLSATAPTLPTGYTYKCRLSATRTASGSAIFQRIRQQGSEANFVVSSATTTFLPPIIQNGSGSTTVPTWTSVSSATSFVPTTATRIRVMLSSGASTQAAMVAPNNNYGALSSISNPPLCNVNMNSTALNSNVICDMQIESMSPVFYYAGSNTGPGVYAYGWKDKVNAN